MTRPLREGKGLKAGPLRKKNFFFKLEKKNYEKNVATKLDEGGRGIRALVVGTLKNVFTASLK